MRFTDARSAGVALSPKLEAYREDAVILALAHGGVAVGLEVAKRLGLPLDLLLIRRLFVPRGPDDPVCAFSMGGNLYLDVEVSAPDEAARDSVREQFVASALSEFEERVRACRGERTQLDLSGKTILLVDNGIRTGSTVRAAVRALRSSAPARIVVAVPVADAVSLASVESVADELIYLASPERFGHVGLWYKDFARPTNVEIREMLEESDARDA